MTKWLPILAVLTSNSARAQFGVPAKPVRTSPAVLLLDAPLTIDDYRITEGDQMVVKSEVSKRHLTLKEFQGFSFYYSERSLHLDDAKRQTQLLKECADALETDPMRVLPIAKLSATAQATLRGLFVSAGSGVSLNRVLMQTSPRLLAGLSSSGMLRLGGLTAGFRTLPHALPQEMEEVLAAGSLAQSVATPPSAPSDSVSFLFGHMIPPETRLRFLHAVQDFLQTECSAASRAFEEASLRAQKAIYGLYASEYDHLLSQGGHPKLSDFDAEDRAEIAAHLTRGPGPEIADVNQFLAEAKAEDFSTHFTLTLFVRVDGRNLRQDVQFTCPIGP